MGNDGQGYSNDLGKSFFQPDICVLQVSCSPIHLISSRKTRYILLAEEEKCTSFSFINSCMLLKVEIYQTDTLAVRTDRTVNAGK